MTFPALLLVLSVLTAPTPQTDADQPTTPEPIAVLLVSGENNHDWEWTHQALEEVLVDSGRFSVDITLDPNVTFEDAVALTKYDIFVLDYNGARWGEPAETNFLAAVRSGTGVAVIHAANNAFPGWVEYEQLVCLLWRKGTGHGSFHSFDVAITDRDHPITRTLPTLKGHPDELYHRLVHMHDAPHRVLATAFSDPKTGGSNAREPMIIVSSFGKGRVFHTPLGHVWRGREETRTSHADQQFQNLFLRGTEWAATGSVTDGDPEPNTLSDEEIAAGWQLLFDGKTTAGWRGWKQDTFPAEGWEVTGGCLRHTRGGGSLVTTGVYSQFDLSFEWKVAAGANSGLKIWIDEANGQIGPEYQLLDDVGHKNGGVARTSAGSIYDVLAPRANKRLALVGSFNRSRIHARGGILEYYLNGELIVRAELDSPEWQAARAAGKFRKSPIFGIQRSGRLLLQDHGDEIWFQSIKLRAYED